MTTVYGATDDAVLVAREGADGTWRVDWHHPADRLECLAASPDVPDRFFVGTVDAGLLRSTDGGASWESVAEFGDHVTAVTVSPHDPEVVWAGTEPSRVFHSADAGDTWTDHPGLTDLPSAGGWSFPPRPHTHHVRWIAVDPAASDRLAVAIEAGALVRSVDGGETWVDHPDGARRDNHTIATHPDAPGRLYTAAGDGYAESPDWGETWAHPQTGLDRRYVWSVAVAPDDPETVVVSAAQGARSAHDPHGEAGVYRRSGDDAWEPAMDGLPGPEGWGRPVLAAHDDGFYALSNHGLFRSVDGVTWGDVDLDWPDDRREQLPRGLAVVP